METDNNRLLDKELIVGMFGAMGTNLKRFINIMIFLSLITFNVLTLASSAVHNMLYGILSCIPIASMTELLANRPT